MYEIVLSIILIIAIIYGKKYYDRWDYINAFKNESVNIEDHFFKSIDRLHYSSKRKMWIHMPTQANGYLLLCLKSIIDHCGQYYNIILFNDADLGTLLSSEDSTDNLTSHQRSILLLALMHEYGGVIMPRHMFLKSTFKPIDNDKFFVSKIYNQGKSVTMSDYVYSTELMGSNKNNPILLEYINKIRKEPHLTFSDDVLKDMDIPYIDPKLIGNQDVYGNKITLEDLMLDKQIEFVSNSIGIMIPHDELLRRPKYNWYCELEPSDVLTAHIFLSKYMMANK
jgi:hypothetical protein